jgi:hypothetical protein
MCMKPQSAYWHQPSTEEEEESIKAVDPPEPSPSVLTMGIPYTVYGSRARGTRSSMAPNCRSLISPPNAQKQACFSRDMLRTGHDAAFSCDPCYGFARAPPDGRILPLRQF